MIRNRLWYIIKVDEQDAGDSLLDDDLGDDEIVDKDKAEKTTEEKSTESDDDKATDTDVDEYGEDEEYESITEVLGKNKAESHVVSAPEGVSNDINDMSFSFDGHVLKIPFDISELTGWEYDTEYFYASDSEIEAGESSNSSYSFSNSAYDKWFNVYIGTCNPTENDVPFEESFARTFSASISYLDTDSYPELILPKGITWHSSLQDIYDAYGDTDSVYVYEDTVYLYYYFDNWDEVEFCVDMNEGVTEISFYNYSWDQ